jgi:ATP-dependent helicase/DNAse subunit B
VARRLFSIYENSRIIPEALIPVILSNLTGKSIGYSCLMADFVNEMKAHNPGTEPAEISNDVQSVFHRLEIPEEVSARTMEAMKSLELYRNILLKCNAMDENDIMGLCPGIIQQRNIRHDVLIIDSIIELTRTDESIMKTLIESAADTMISIPYDADYNNITERYMTYLNNHFKITSEYFQHGDAADIYTHYAYHDVEEEISEIARNIKYRFITGAGTDPDNVFVVFPRIHQYLEMITRIFGKYGIPFTITSDRPLAKTKPFLDLMAVLESVSKDYPRLPFSQFLVSPYFKAIPSSLREFIPSMCISSGLTNGKKCWMDLVKSDRNQTGRDIFSKSNYPTIAKDLAAVFRKLSHLEAIRHRASFSDFGEAVIRLLNDFDFDEGTDRDRNNVEAMINTAHEISLVDVFSDNSSTDLHHYTEVLRHCLLSVPSNQTDMTGVRIMSFKDLYGLEPHYLYFGGLRDGDFPWKPEMDHLLPDNVRTELGLLTMERSIQQQKFHFRRALSSAKHYDLSYAAMEGDRLFLPSSFLPWNKEIPKSVRGIYSREEELIRRGRVPRASIISDIGRTNRRVVRKIFGKKSAIRVTDIDAYRTCPRKFFIEKVLDMRPLEIMKFEIDALTLGTIVHEIMQEIVPDFSPGGDDFIRKAHTKIEAILSKKTIDSYWKRVVRDTILSVLPVISCIEQTIADDGYVFMAAEVPVQAEVLPGITLNEVRYRLRLRSR